MKITMNLTNFCDDLDRFEDEEDLRAYLAEHRLDGIELMEVETGDNDVVPDDLVVGVHLPYYVAWLDFLRGDTEGVLREFGSLDVARKHYGSDDPSCIIRRYKESLASAHKHGAEYVVFHVGESGVRENFTFDFARRDEEVIDASCEIINELFADEDGSVALLLENLWQPGLTLLRPEMTERLLDGVHYANKGIMLDTGHLLHTNFDLRTQEQAVSYVMSCLDAHGDLCRFIRGVHFHQSLTGAYCKKTIANPPDLRGSYEEVFGQGFLHSFSVDCHKPWTVSDARAVLDRLPLEYCTLEYISSSRAQHASYLRAAQVALPR